MSTFWANIWYNFTHITFKGRSSAKEYQYWFLFCILYFVLTCVMLFVPNIYLQTIANNSEEALLALGLSFYIILAAIVFCVFSIWKGLADLTLVVRRLHDMNKTGWWFVGYFVIAFIIAFVITLGFSIILVGAQISRETSDLLIKACSNILTFLFSFIFVLFCMIKKGHPSENRFGDPVLEVHTNKVAKPLSAEQKHE